MEALTDSDADERANVVKTLSEQEISTTELVQRVFSQVQSEFTTWNVAHCHDTLTSFAPPSTWKSCLPPDLRSPTLASMPTTSNSSSGVQSVASEANSPSPPVMYQLQVHSTDGVVIEISSVQLQRSMFKGDDSDNMAFIPYADDPTFDQIGHMHHYGSLSWQDVFDPDLEVIVLETVYRLRIRYALDYDEIEGSNVLPLKLRSQPGVPGVLTTSRRRDRLHWAGNTIPVSYSFPPLTCPMGPDFRKRLQTLNSLFCPNLNCLEPLCSVHVEPNPMPLQSRFSPPPITLGEVTSPCRNQCFIGNKIEQTSPSWGKIDIEIFQVISEISPNATSCDLAELCLKPCNEVFYYRRLFYSCKLDETQPTNIKHQRRTPRFNDRSPTHFTPNDPCHHTGPCSNSSSCPCFKNQSHCQRNCRCSLNCNRRWQGCRCLSDESGWNCAIKQCPCVESSRECDPELCVNCRCIGKLRHFWFRRLIFLEILADDTPCRNSQIQRGVYKELKIKKSRWGLGTFLVEAAKAGDLITEYVGELIYEPTVESRGDLAAHRSRCYVFGLDNTFSLDATYAGNISRFINHFDGEPGRQEYSQAQVRLVNGEYRIGIFAVRDMEAGSEVLISYGPRFFIE